MCRSADDPHMQVCLLKSKIHRATITDGNLKYEGSLTIAADLMEKCGLIAYERILCSNMANGNRFETYAIPGDPGAPNRHGPHAATTRRPSPSRAVAATNVSARNCLPTRLSLPRKSRAISLSPKPVATSPHSWHAVDTQSKMQINFSTICAHNRFC